MDTTKIAGFVQGVFYPVAAVVLWYVINNLGASGIFSASTSLVITGVLSVIENLIEAKTGKVMFGAMS